MVLDSIYLFSYESKPEMSAAKAGTGALQSIASWTAVPEKRGFRYDLDEVEDPDPTGSQLVYSFWVAHNFRFEAGAQIQTVLQELLFQRPWAHTRRVEVTFADVIAAWPTAQKYATASQIDSAITLAKTDVRNDLTAAGYEWGEIRRPDRLNQSILYRALGHIAFTQIQQTGDHWDRQSQEWKRMSHKIREELKFEYDGAKTGATQTTNTQSGFRFINR